MPGMTQTDPALGMAEPDAPIRLPDPRDRPTLPLWPTTGNLLGLSKQSTYDAAARGDIPVIRIGRRILVPTAALAKMLCIESVAGEPVAS
jgi:hypothetical protein